MEQSEVAPVNLENLMDSVDHWLARDPDPTTRGQVEKLVKASSYAELAKCFSGRIQFGTAGLRALVGAGPTNMNRLVVRETTMGVARYALQKIHQAAERGVIITFDGRLDSRIFAQDAACVMSGFGFRVFLTARETPTPLGACAVKKYGTALGIVITASHNPPQYNGYKLYWENGAQIIPPHDKGIAEEIERAARQEIPWKDLDEGLSQGAVTILGEELEQSYYDELMAMPWVSRSDTNNSKQKEVPIAYTAMHGVGAKMAIKLLEGAGFSQFYSVPSQHQPDGNFPTVEFPNPEEPGAMDAVIALAQEKQATLACANDPDADRFAVAVRDSCGNYQPLTGDQVGVLLGHYLLQMDHDFTPIVCTTIVSSSMLRSIAENYSAVFIETLTGFKWLANQALDCQDQQHQLLFAYEEALGYSIGNRVCDKDGLSALLVFAQLTEQLAQQGKTVFDQLEILYRKYGLHITAQRTLPLEETAISPAEQLRSQPPGEIADHKVLSVDDLKKGRRQYADGRIETLPFARSDVLVYRLENGYRVILRPSGTEPKLKCYYETVRKLSLNTEFSEGQQQANTDLNQLIDSHQKSLRLS